MLRFYRTATAIFVGLYAVILCFGPNTSSAPLKANYFLHNTISVAQAKELAKWDLLILDMDVAVTSREALNTIRRLNPDVIMLAYITSQEIRSDALSQNWSALRRKLASGIQEQWYVTDLSGNKMSYWPETYLLNASDSCPVVNGTQWNKYLARFVNNEILSDDIWSGVFYDNGWDGLTWATGNRADLNRDGSADTGTDDHWRAGMKELFRETSALDGGRHLVITNGANKAYREEVSGIMIENFAQNGWSPNMEVYHFQETGGKQPRVIIINANTGNNAGQDGFKKMRFGLASALLGDGYYSYDFGSENHGQTWWYDEYNVNLGAPAGEARSLNGVAGFQEDVWQREYENGLAIANATGASKDINLGADYEKIIGKQDPATNDGSVVDKVRVGGKDGLILLKTFSTIKNAVFGNGYFLRFFDMRGNRMRNGFFAYEEGLPGGAQIYYGDLDGAGAEEKATMNGMQFVVFNSRGEYWFKEYLQAADFRGAPRLAVGKLSEAQSQIVTGGSQSGRLKLFNYHGGLLKDAAYPLGKNYRGGFSLAIGNVDGGVGGEVILGTGVGRAAEVLVMDSQLAKIKNRFFPFGKKTMGPLLVAAGDMNKDGKAEIITALSGGTKSVVRIYDGAGKLLSEFTAGAMLGGRTVSLAAADVNFDGADEVVVMTK